MGKVKTEAELVAFAKDLLPLIDELRDIQKRSGVTCINLSISGDPEDIFGTNRLSVQAEPGDLDVIHISATQYLGHKGMDESWHYTLDSTYSKEDLRGTF